jgi:hypothetical protein
MNRTIRIFDTTLRDGEQSPGASMNVDEKTTLAKQLARLGVDIIEAGFAIASPGDFEAIRRIGGEVEGPVICSLARAKEPDIRKAWEALRDAPRKRLHTFHSTSDIHLKYQYRIDQAEALKRSVDMVRLAKSLVDDVEFSAMDATRTDPTYLCDVMEAVIDAGAGTINIPDTVGYTMPEEFGKLIRTVRPCGGELPCRCPERSRAGRVHGERHRRAGGELFHGRGRHGAQDPKGLLRRRDGHHDGGDHQDQQAGDQDHGHYGPAQQGDRRSKCFCP